MSSRAGWASPARPKSAYNPDSRSSKNISSCEWICPQSCGDRSIFWWYPSWPDTAFSESSHPKEIPSLILWPSSAAIKSLYGICGIDQAADRFRILKIGRKIRPVLLPRFRDLGIFAAPFFVKAVQFGQRSLFCWSRIYTFQIFHQRLQLFVGNELCCISDLMNDTLLDLCLGENGFDCLGEACQPIHSCDQDSDTPRFFRPFRIESQNFAHSFCPTYIPERPYDRPYLSRSRYRPHALRSGLHYAHGNGSHPWKRLHRSLPAAFPAILLRWEGFIRMLYYHPRYINFLCNFKQE